MKLDDIISKHIGDLTIEMARMRIIIQEQAERIKVLTDAATKAAANVIEPELPMMNGKDHLKEFRNGSH